MNAPAPTATPDKPEVKAKPLPKGYCRCFNPKHAKKPVHKAPCRSKKLQAKIVARSHKTSQQPPQKKLFHRKPKAEIHNTVSISQPATRQTNVIFRTKSVVKRQTRQLDARTWDRVLSLGVTAYAAEAPATTATYDARTPVTAAEDFGKYRYNRGLSKSHHGIDIGPPRPGDPNGSQVIHLRTGRVWKVKNQRGRAGNYLTSDQGNHFITYMHLPNMPTNPQTGMVWQKGEEMPAGTVIAEKFGKTGNASNYCLHIEVRVKKANGKPGAAVDPRIFYPELKSLRR